jgi:hypothetical protein
LLDDLKDMPLDRRALIRSAILLVGGSVTAAPAMALAQAAAAAPRYFTPGQFAVLDEVAAIIIPKTETPGAREAGVPGFVDALMAQWAAPVTAQQTRDLIDQIDLTTKEKFGAPLLSLTPDRRIEAMRAFDAEAMGSNRVYRRFKELVMLTYYFSEAGATQELRYELVPGVWEGSVPLKPGQPAWAV